MQLRGRAEPVQVHVLGRAASARRGNAVRAARCPARPRGHPPGVARPSGCYAASNAGGARPQPAGHLRLDDTKVSRSHARIDWTGGTFQLTDMSYNGTYVRFLGQRSWSRCAAAAAPCTATASSAWAARPPTRPRRACSFDVLSIVDTVPRRVRRRLRRGRRGSGAEPVSQRDQVGALPIGLWRIGMLGGRGQPGPSNPGGAQTGGARTRHVEPRIVAHMQHRLRRCA